MSFPCELIDLEITLVWIGLVLRQINHCWLFNVKSRLYTHIKYIRFC